MRAITKDTMTLVSDASISVPDALLGIGRHDLLGLDGRTAPMYLLEFDHGRFSLQAFATSEITCPPSVARSVSKRRAEFFFGRLAARLALSDVAFVRDGRTTRSATPSDKDSNANIDPGTMRSVAAIEVPIGPAREPIWPSGLIGSISHSATFAAALVDTLGPRQGVGIDLERVIGPDDYGALLGVVVNEAELNYLHTLTGNWPLEQLLTLVFSAKESLFKGAYAAVGRYFDFSAVQLVELDFARRQVRFQLTETLCPQFTCLQHCAVAFSFLRPDLLLTHFVW